MLDERGMTLTELLTAMVVMSLVAVTVITYSLPWVARETMKSALHDTGAVLQLTKIEAASRNRPCRFVVNTATGALEVWDTQNTATLADDVRLHRQPLPESVAFDRPDSGAVVTLQQIGTTSAYTSVVGPDGMVNAGTGDVHYFGGDRYGRVSLHAAGGIELSHWDGTAWQAGS